MDEGDTGGATGAVGEREAISSGMMYSRAVGLVVLACSAVAWGQKAPATQPTIYAKATRESAIYKAGETVTFEVSTALFQGDEGKYVVLKDGKTPIAEGAFPLNGEKAQITAKLDGRGWLFVRLKAGEVQKLAGAVVAPWEIKPAAERPADFDSFWDGKLEELKKVPINSKEEKVDGIATGVDYYRVTLDNIRGSHVYGQLARPADSANGKKFPAVLVVQSAGVYPLKRQWVVDKAKRGFLTLNIMAHDEPFDLAEAEYTKLAAGKLADYAMQGSTSRETSYLLRMALGCRRACDYLMSRPDWDGRTLIVTGTSQGGFQAIIASAFCPEITHIIANVPAGCATTAEYDVTNMGWPYFVARSARKGTSEGDRAKILETAKYFDIVNFASKSKAKAFVAIGLIDTSCPASGTLAMINELKGEKKIVVMPEASHKEGHGAWYSESEKWWKALSEGKAVGTD